MNSLLALGTLALLWLYVSGGRVAAIVVGEISGADESLLPEPASRADSWPRPVASGAKRRSPPHAAALACLPATAISRSRYPPGRLRLSPAEAH